MYDIPPGIDHIIVFVRDINTAARDYERMLGFPPSWRGHHPALGTCNVLFRLQNTYLELLAADQPGVGSDAVQAFLDEKGEGLAGLVFGVEDITAFAARLGKKGLQVDAPQAGSGRDDLTGTERHWHTLYWPLSASRNVFSFAIQHHSPPDSLPFKQTGAAHEVCGVDHIVINTADGDAAAAFYGDTLGIRLALRQDKPQWGGDMLFFRTSHMSLEVIASANNDPLQDSFWGLALRTADIEATHARLHDAGVSVSGIRNGRKPGTRVCTVKSHCCCVPTLLIGSP